MNESVRAKLNDSRRIILEKHPEITNCGIDFVLNPVGTVQDKVCFDVARITAKLILSNGEEVSAHYLKENFVVSDLDFVLEEISNQIDSILEKEKND